MVQFLFSKLFWLFNIIIIVIFSENYNKLNMNVITKRFEKLWGMNYSASHYMTESINTNISKSKSKSINEKIKKQMDKIKKLKN